MYDSVDHIVSEFVYRQESHLRCEQVEFVPEKTGPHVQVQLSAWVSANSGDVPPIL